MPHLLLEHLVGPNLRRLVKEDGPLSFEDVLEAGRTCSLPRSSGCGLRPQLQARPKRMPTYVPRSLEALIVRMLETDPSERPGAAAVADELAGL